ncbi:MAG: 5-formyltetrahydrofolate cyclo-ligase [Solobacterium sp.]|nr:5-formyltetrahydrofolate cyclo-ligase [Solobacterium sp.]
MDKKTARRQGLQARSLILEAERKRRSSLLVQKAAELLSEYDIIGCYVSMKDEADTHGLLNACLKAGKTVCVPKVQGDTLVFMEITSLDELEPGSFGVMEPVDGRIIDPEDIGLMFIPLSAYDAVNHRTGYGRGYYDSILNERQYKLGVAFKEQKVDLIEADPWDVMLDGVIEL